MRYINNNNVCHSTGWLKKCKLLILCGCVNENREDRRRNVNKYEQLQRKWSIVWYFHVRYFCQYCLCLNILWLKAVSVGTTILLSKCERERYVNMTSLQCALQRNYRNRTQIMLFAICYFCYFCDINFVEISTRVYSLLFEPPCVLKNVPTRVAIKALVQWHEIRRFSIITNT